MTGISIGLALSGVTFFLLMSAFFSGTETGILSCSFLKAKNKSQKGDKKSRLLTFILNNKRDAIIGTLIGTNLANTAFSLFGEYLILKIWSRFKAPNLSYQPGFITITIILATCLLIFAEITPKAIFRHYSFSLTRSMSYAIYLSFQCLRPFARPFIYLTHIMLGPHYTSLKYTRKAISSLTEKGIETGDLKSSQEKLVRRIMSLSDKSLAELAIPFSSNCCFEDMKREQIIRHLRQSNGKKVIFLKKQTKITGFIYLQDIWRMPQGAAASKYSTNVTRLPSTKPGILALKYLLFSKRKLVVISEDNQDLGFVTAGNLLSFDDM
jgi:putative hemolysin